MPKRRLTPAYIFFYLLLADDTWRIAAGFILAVWLGPLLTQGRHLNRAAEVMVWLMILAIGWSLTGWPAKKITGFLKRAVKQASR